MLRDHENLGTAARMPARPVERRPRLAREVWQWRDANGVTHFSDYPQPGARKIVLNGSPSTTSATRDRRRQRPPPGRRAQPAAAEITYDRLEIWSPGERRQLLRARRGHQRSRAARSPSSAPTDRLLTYLDGKLLAGRERHGALAHQRGARRAFGDQRDRRPRRPGTDPQRAGRLSHEAADRDQPAQPGPPRRCVPPHAQGRLNSLATASRLTGGA